MPDEFELSRRKALAALGTVGAASAGAGLGTSAFFSDQETFENNQLTAGTLDMKVSWEEHYSDWSEDEAEHAHMEDGELVVDDREGFMNATLQEEFPDKHTRRLLEEGTADPCEVLADVPDDLEKPVIEIEDVKPGDFGEVTFDFALCDNPGYVWMNGELLESAENGLTEPEADDPDENGRLGDSTGELEEAIQTTIWYDSDCNNVVDSNESVVFRGSLQEALNALSGNQGRGIPLDGDSSLRSNFDELTQPEEDPDRQCFPKRGLDITRRELQRIKETKESTPLLNHSYFEELHDSQFFQRYMPLIDRSDLDPVFSEATVLHFPEAGSNHVVSLPLIDPGDDASEAIKESGGVMYVEGLNNDLEPQLGMLVAMPGDGTIHFIFDSDGRKDVVVFDEQLRFVRFERQHDLALDIDIPEWWEDFKQWLEKTFEEIPEWMQWLCGIACGGCIFASRPDPRSLVAWAACIHCIAAFISVCIPIEDVPAPENVCLGFKWELPVDHGNEVQSDSVKFDLGFYTEQCRHNDGAGMNDEPVGDDEPAL